MNDIEIVKRELKKRSQGDGFFGEVCHIAIGYIDNLENTIKEKQKHLENLQKVNEELEERIAIMKKSSENRLNHHEVACIIADLFSDSCACNFNGNDEWLPQHCDFANTCCPNPGGVACWEQYLKHMDKKPPKVGETE